MWWKLGLGLLVIALLAAGMVAASREMEMGRAVDSDALERPVLWLGEDRLVTVYKGAVRVRALDAFDAPETLFDARSVDGANRIGRACFSPTRFTLGLWRRSVDETRVSIKNVAKTVVATLENGAIVSTRVEDSETLWVNQLDCRPDADFDAKRRVFAEATATTGRAYALSDNHALALGADAEVSAGFVRYAGEEGTTILAAFKTGDAVKSLRLRPPPGVVHRGLGVSLDRARGGYLYVSPTTDFFDLSAWPRPAWRVSRDFETVDEIALPAGPWVRNGSFLKSLSCFSCGCGCYARMRVFARDGAILVSVRGRAAWRGTRGVWRLSPGGAAWRAALSAHILDDVAISRSGCRIAYTDGRLGVRDDCAGRDWRL